MTIREMRIKVGISQVAFAKYLNMPRRTLENWDSGLRGCPSYVLELIQYKLEKENMFKEEIEDTGGKKGGE